MNDLQGFSHENFNKLFLAAALLLMLAGNAAAEASIQKEPDWNGEEIIGISGNWNFYWNTMLTSMDDIPDGVKAYTIPFIGSWHTNTKGEEQLPRHGCGTYQKRIMLPPETGSRVILRIPQLDTALRIFCNGVEIFSNGTVGCSAETTKPVSYKPVLREISSATGIYDISIQAANFDLDSFGYYMVPVIASADKAFKVQFIAFMSNALIVTALFILSLYLLVTGIKMENNRWCLYLCFLYLANVLYLLVNGEVFLGQIGLSRLYIWKFHYLSRFLTSFFFFCFTTEFFHVRIPSKLNLAKNIFAVLLLSVFLLADLPLLQRFFLLSQVIAYGVIIYGIVVSLKGIIEKYPYARVFFISIIIVAVFMSFDLINIPTSWPILFNCKTSIGLIFFGLIHLFLLIDMMKNHLNTIEELVERRTRALEVSLWAQARHARVGEMLNFIAHQWQQYLYAISINVEGLKQEKDRSFPEEKRYEIYGTISEAVKSMFSTLKDFRNFLSPVQERERFNAADECKKVFSLMEDLFLTNGIEVSIETSGDTRIWGIKNELQQVVLNLLTNAVNIIMKRSIVSPYIRFVLEGDSDLVTISVEDNGGGISDSLREELFEREKTEITDGSGMGLYMSRRIIRERFHGELSCKEGLAGAIFVITIPRDYRRSKRQK